ncbi:hypothetical protein ACIGZJ_34630 [Kitasatospora sp. NPDC052868]|uniref:hypothetical protein n=1 Tax=Kitasatospora sp. NPDC052868 TaxID=3364060 RepID=UPI0037C5CB4E
MTTPPLPRSPLPHSPAPDRTGTGGGAQARRGQEPAALHRAAGAGQAAAAWVRRLAARQGDQGHARALERAADAIERASGPEVIPGGDGHLVEELRHALAADVLLGAARTGTLPELHPGERGVLVAVCALAAAMPGCVLGDLEHELGVLAGELEHTAEAGRTATTASETRQLPARRRRLVLGGDRDDSPTLRHVGARAAHAFEIALHYQGRGQEARTEALFNALAAAGPGIAATALARIADDPALGLDDDQKDYLHTVAADLDIDTVANLIGAGSGHAPAASPA